jgi:hypothetical protein
LRLRQEIKQLPCPKARPLPEQLVLDQLKHLVPNANPLAHFAKASIMVKKFSNTNFRSNSSIGYDNSTLSDVSDGSATQEEDWVIVLNFTWILSRKFSGSSTRKCIRNLPGILLGISLGLLVRILQRILFLKFYKEFN